MTRKKGDKWDDEEKINDDILELIDLMFNPATGLTKEEMMDDVHLVTAHAINRYARIKEIECLPLKDLFKDKKAFKKFHDSLIRSAYSKPNEKQEDFFWFTLEEYGIEITREYCRKVSDEEIDAMLKLLKGEISEKEFVKQRSQIQYPTIDDKKSIIDFDIQRQLDYIEKTENDDGPIRPEVVARIRSHIEGYEDAPDMYKMARAFVYQAAQDKDWDEAEIEKVLAETIEDMLKDGKINKKEYAKIKKIVKRETDKKIHLEK